MTEYFTIFHANIKYYDYSQPSLVLRTALVRATTAQVNRLRLQRRGLVSLPPLWQVTLSARR